MHYQFRYVCQLQSEKEGYYASNNEKQTTTGSSFLQRSSDLRKEATEELERELKESGIKFSKADRVSKTDRQGSPGTVLRLTHWGRTQGVQELGSLALNRNALGGGRLPEQGLWY